MRLDKLTIKAQEALQAAHELAASRAHQELTPEHVLAALLDQADGITGAILRKLGVDPATVRKAVADALDAMTTDRVYRKAMPLARAMEEFRRFAGVQFDPYCITLLEEAWHRGTLHDGYSATTPTLHELIAEIR